MALTLEIVTPEQRVVTVSCDEVRMTAVDGQFGVRPGHTPLVAALAPGELVYVAGGAPHRFVAGDGFAEVSDDRVRVLVDEAQRAEELDVQRTAQELAEGERALGALKPGDPAYEQQRARVERAAARAFVARVR
jgi:F-type H+-transporting ATPase subunit epsilon